MTKERPSPTVLAPETTQPTNAEGNPHPSREIRRGCFLKGLGVAGAALSASAFLGTKAAAEERSGSMTKGDAAILHFLAAAEIIESDLWLQYQELGGTQDNEVSKLASKLIPGYPAQPTGGNPVYMQDLIALDGDMSQHIHDNTEDELTHEVLINAYPKSKGADRVTLDRIRILPSSKATGANLFGRLTNLMQLSVDTIWWTRHRSRTKKPDFGDTPAQAIPTLAVGQHPATPRTDADSSDANFIQAIANTAGFHFAFIEQVGSSLYPKLGTEGHQCPSSKHSISPAKIKNLIPKRVFTIAGDVSATPTVAGDAVFFPDWAGNLFALRRTAVSGLRRTGELAIQVLIKETRGGWMHKRKTTGFRDWILRQPN